MSMNNSNNDTLTNHIQKHNLNLEKHGFVPGNGDCFYTSIFNLCQLHGVDIPATNVLDIRKWIVDNNKNHPQFKDWLASIWGSQIRKFNDFVRQHRNAGVFTDNFGIILYTTQHLLRVNINLVSSGNNDQNPFTRFDGPNGSTDNPDFWIEYHQDTTDLQGRVPQSQIRAGHHESLKKIEEAPAESVDDQNELQ